MSMTIAPAYRWPLIAALIFHTILLGCFFIHPSASQYRLSHQSGHAIVQASAVSTATVQQAMHSIETRQTAQAHAAAQHLAALKHQAKLAENERKAEAVHIHAMHVEQEKLKAQHRRAVAQVAALHHQQAKLRAQEKAQKLAAKQKAHKKALAHHRQLAALSAKQKKLEQQLMAQQLAGDSKQVKQLQASQDQGVINKYKALILSAIGQQWLIPTGVSHTLQSVYEVHLAPGGTVLSVTLVTSSGNAALDQSAKIAILKASPLPVPKSPRQFDNFRDLRLTVSPQAVIHT